MNHPLLTQSMPAPVDAAHHLTGVRVLMVGISHLSTGVATELRASPLECRVAQRLDVDELSSADLVLVADIRQLSRVSSAVATLGEQGERVPSVVVMGDPMALPFGADVSIDPVFILPTGSDETVARQLLRCIAGTLVKKGSMVPSQPLGTSLRPRRGGRASRRPSQTPWSSAGVPSGRPLVPLAASGPASGVRDTEQVPGPPRLPQSWLPKGGTEPIPALRTSVERPAELNSLMPKVLTITGSRWIVLDDDVARAHAIATALKDNGGMVEVSGLQPSTTRLHALRGLDAAGLLLAESSLGSIGALLRSFEEDARLRHVAVVPVRFPSLFDERTGEVDHEALKLLLLPHWQPEHDLLECLFAGHEVEVARVGSAKLLRAAARRQGQFELHFEEDGHTWTIELRSGELLSIAVDGQPCDHERCGEALDSLLELRQGRARLRSSAAGGRGTMLGSVSCVLKIHAVHGAPLSRTSAWQRRFGPVHRLGSLLTVTSKTVAARARRVCQRYPNAAALAGGVAFTSAVVGLVLAGRAPATEHTQTGPADPHVTAAPEATEQDVSATAGAATAPTEHRTAARAEGSAADTDAPGAAASERDLADFPQGCGRWLSAQQLDKLQPAQAGPAMRMAGKAVLVGDLAKAEELLCLSIAMDPTGPGAAGLVRFHFSRENVEAATQWAEWAYSKQPTDPDVKQLLADVRNRQGRLDEARALLHDAMNVSAADVRVLRQVARKYAESGYKALRALDPGQADRLFRRAATLDGQNALALAGMSQLALRRGNVVEALEHALEAVKLDRNHFEAQLALGDAHAENQQIELAKAAWLEAARLRPTSREARTRLGL